MTNWRVTVQTDSSQIKEVFVEDYIQPDDAARAALSQTGAAEVLYVIPDYSYESKSSSGTSSSTYNTNVSYDSDLNMLEGFLLMFAGICIFLGMFSLPILQLSGILFVSCFVHYIIRKLKG